MIGRKCKHLTRENALSAVLGYTIGNDVSERTWQKADRTLWRAKNTDTFKPMGPWIETNVKLEDLVTKVRLNGEEVSVFPTNHMVFGVVDFLVAMTKYLTLYPGDVLWMGTEGATQNMKHGDVCEVEISSIGTLRNPSFGRPEMDMQREVVVVSGVRTAIGDFGGGLKDVAPTDLGAQVVREALSRASVDGAEVGQVVFGNVIHTEPKDMYLARVAAMNAGVAKEAPALTLNRLCGSGIAGRGVGGADHHAGRHRHRGGGRGREHEPLRLSRAGCALGRADGRCGDGRHDARRAARPVRQHPHG